MDPLLWERIQALLDDVFELSSSERAAYLEQVTDPQLRSALQELIAADADAGRFLERALTDYAAPLWAGSEGSRAIDRSGAVVGPFRLLREVGRGGMGAVYLAERTDGFEQRVALKLIQAGLASDEALGRFVRERQILARLEHPGIARLVDGGLTAEGLPYFAMEFVEGEEITAYCDRRRLDVQRRLRLFRQVCDAVQYAHSHLVVHRDLKPSNVLVTDDRRVKLLDFGIAKLLDPAAGEKDLTRTWMRVLTPECASPEQVSGEPVTVASDVYQLGVLLYELLSGQRPFSFASRTRTSIERVICNTNPSAPSAVARRDSAAAQARRASRRELARLLRGDLDNVVAKALRKEPERRYQSVGLLLDDLERHRKGLPVSARPDTLGYRAGKFVRRHPFGAAASAAIVLLLVAYALTVTWQARRLADERDQVSIEARKAERVKSFLAGLFEAADPYGERGTSVTVDELLEAGVREVRSELAEEPAIRAEMLSVLGQGLAALGSYDRAGELLKEALEIQREAFAGSDHPDLATTLDRYRAVLNSQGDHEASEVLAREALAMRRRLFGERHPAVVESLDSVGRALLFQGDPAAAEALFRQALAAHRSLPAPGDDAWLAALLNNLASSLNGQERYIEALRLHRESLEIRRRLYDSDHPAVSESLNNLGVASRNAGNYSQAEALFREALGVRRRVFGNDHPRVANSLGNLGAVLRRMGRLEEAAACHQEALAIRRAALGENHNNVGLSLHQLAASLHDAGSVAEAEQLLRAALTILRNAYPKGHRRVSAAAVSLGRLQVAQGRSSEAEGLLTEALAISLAVTADDSIATSEARLALGLCRAAQRRPEEARELLGTGLARLRASSAGDRKLVAEAEAALARLAESGG